MKNIFIIALTLLNLSYFTNAQEEKLRIIEASFYAFKYNPNYKTVHYNKNAEKIEQLSLSTANIRGPYNAQLDSNNQLILRTAKTNGDETIYPPIMKVKIPTDITDALVILVPSKTGYNGLVIDRNITKFTKGSYRLVNFSKNNIRGLIGKTRVAAPPQSITSFDPSNTPEKAMVVQFQQQIDGKWQTFNTTRWSKEKNIRQLVCVYRDPKTDHTKMRGIRLKHKAKKNTQPQDKQAQAQ